MLNASLLDPGAVARWAALFYPNTPKPDSETAAGQERLQAYYLALGKFVDTYAHTELQTHFVLRWFTKTSSDIARAVFSGVRTKEALAYLGRLASVRRISTAEWLELEPVVIQLRLINERRNDILHHGASDVAAGGGTVSNDAMALTPKHVQSFPISPEILDDMTADLLKINAHFLTRHMGRLPLRGKHPDLDAVLAASWRYTPPQQSQNRDRQEDKKTTRRRPRPASPESPPHRS